MDTFPLVFLQLKKKTNKLKKKNKIEVPPNPQNYLAEGMCSCLQLLILVFRD